MSLSKGSLLVEYQYQFRNLKTETLETNTGFTLKVWAPAVLSGKMQMSEILFDRTGREMPKEETIIPEL